MWNGLYVIKTGRQRYCSRSSLKMVVEESNQDSVVLKNKVGIKNNNGYR